MVKEFSDDQRSFCTQRKLQGATLARIHQEYEHWWPMPTWGIVNPPPPSDRCLRRWLAKLSNKKTLQDLRKKRKASRDGVVTVCTPANIARVNFFTLIFFLTSVTQVRNHLDAESARQPGEPGSSKRRNRWRRLFSPSTFLKIVRKELGLHAFR